MSSSGQHMHAEGDCHQVLTQLNDYADGELSVDLCQDLDAHLAECDNCQVVLDTLKHTIYLVHHLDDQASELPNDVEQRLFAVLDLEEYLPANELGENEGTVV